MGYALVFSPCINCGSIFGYNPHRVPSTRAVTGHREPVCRACYDRLNKKRVAIGMEPWPPPHPDAYEPIEEGEL
jgi:hypothetical protein